MVNTYLSVKMSRELKQWRKHFGITQVEAAERCGMNRHNYCAIENRKRALTLSSLIRMADALGLKVVMHLVPKFPKEP